MGVQLAGRDLNISDEHAHRAEEGGPDVVHHADDGIIIGCVAIFVDDAQAKLNLHLVGEHEVPRRELGHLEREAVVCDDGGRGQRERVVGVPC